MPKAPATARTRVIKERREKGDFYFEPAQEGEGSLIDLLNWISEWDWETKGPAMIGCVGWMEPSGRDAQDAVMEYCEAHLGQFDFVSAQLAPEGNMLWATEISRLRDYDYICITSFDAQADFVEQARDRGYAGKFVGREALSGPWVLLMD